MALVGMYKMTLVGGTTADDYVGSRDLDVACESQTGGVICPASLLDVAGKENRAITISSNQFTLNPIAPVYEGLGATLSLEGDITDYTYSNTDSFSYFFVFKRIPTITNAFCWLVSKGDNVLQNPLVSYPVGNQISAGQKYGLFLNFEEDIIELHLGGRILSSSMTSDLGRHTVGFSYGGSDDGTITFDGNTLSLSSSGTSPSFSGDERLNLGMGFYGITDFEFPFITMDNTHIFNVKKPHAFMKTMHSFYNGIF